MKIVIVGAGAVGSYLAERFSLEGQDVVVIESDPGRAAQVQGELDALVITGNGASAKTLRQAGLEEADLLVAHEIGKPAWTFSPGRSAVAVLP